MSLNRVSVASFGNELEKIAYLRQAAKAGFKAWQKGKGVGGAVSVGRKAARHGRREVQFAKSLARKPNEGAAGHALRKGWADLGGAHGNKGGWMGAKDTWRKNIPIGGKSMAVGFTAMGVPGAVKKEDPQGRGRSRTERLLQLGAGTLGGIAGVGAVMKGKSPGFLRSAIGGMGGAIGAEKLVSMPFNKSRTQRMQGGPVSRADRAQLLQQALPAQQSRAV